MGKPLQLGEDWEITLCILFVVGAIVSIWIVIFSPTLLDWMGAGQYRGKYMKDKRNWQRVFLVAALLQPITFLSSAIGLWWVSYMAILPPIHLIITVLAFLAVDFFREETKQEEETRKFLGR